MLLKSQYIAYVDALFNKLHFCTFVQSYTQYIPLPITDLDSWLKTPSIYVFDCSAAGMIVKAFLEVYSLAPTEICTLEDLWIIAFVSLYDV
jgi:hypothetical protein